MSSLVAVLSVLTAVFVFSTCFLIHYQITMSLRRSRKASGLVALWSHRCEQAFVHCSFVVFVAVLISWPVLATLYDSALVSFVFFVVFAIIFLSMVVYYFVGPWRSGPETDTWYVFLPFFVAFLFFVLVSFGLALSLGIVAFAWVHEMDQTAANASVGNIMGNITGTPSASGNVGNVSTHTQTFLSAPWFEPVFWGLVTVVTAVFVLSTCFLSHYHIWDND